MKVYSKQRDYYDSVLSSYGEGDAVVFAREEVNVNYSLYKWNDKDKYSDPSIQQLLVDFVNVPNKGSWYWRYRFEERLNVYRNVLFFCGKAYSFLTLSTTLLKSINDNKLLFIYSYEDLKNLKDDNGNIVYNEDMIKGYENYFNIIRDTRIDDYLLKINNPICLFYDINYNSMRSYQEQVSYYEYSPIILKDINFQKVVDPYTAHQEIEMYLSNVLCANTKDIPQIDDEHMKLQKGFDEWSFKNPPSKKK